MSGKPHGPSKHTERARSVRETGHVMRREWQHSAVPNEPVVWTSALDREACAPGTPAVLGEARARAAISGAVAVA
jgi:hypothetical protein